MSRLRGWCACGGPLWRWDGCRLCVLEIAPLLEGVLPWDWERFADRPDDANSTADTAAWSTWLPPDVPPWASPAVSCWSAATLLGGRMTRRPHSIRWRPDLLARLQAVAPERGVTVTEAVHLAVEAWLVPSAERQELAELRERLERARRAVGP